jgi:hypothetical protein
MIVCMVIKYSRSRAIYLFLHIGDDDGGGYGSGVAPAAMRACTTSR